jgi:hypothetical protein
VDLPFAQVMVASGDPAWPGQPLLLVVDGRSALLAARDGERVVGHWSTSSTLVAAATLAIGGLRRQA